MNEEALDHVLGQQAAMNAVIMLLCTTLTPVQAAETAVQLELERQELNSLDHDEGTSDTQASIRDGMLQSYLKLLSAISKR